jgi:uncharacterized membrane protein YbhN (UPF0104 family)
MKGRRQLLLFVAKAAISFGLLTLLLSRLDVRQFSEILVSADLFYLGVAIGAYFLGKIMTSARWAVVARPLGFRNPLNEFAAFYFLGMFVNLFAPSSLGGDAARVFYLFKERPKTEAGGGEQVSISRAVLSAVVDRAIGLAVLIWIGAVALLAFPAYASAVPRTARALILIVALGLCLAWLLLPFAGRLLRLLKPTAWMADLQQSLDSYTANPWLSFQAVLLSVIIHCIQVWVQILIGRAIGLDIPWSYSFIFFPMVDILSMLPVSVSGLGLREGGYFFFLGKLGMDPEKAVACGTLWFLVVLVNGLVGGAVFLIFRKTATPRFPVEARQAPPE